MGIPPSSVPIRWPIYLILCIVSIAGLAFDYRTRHRIESSVGTISLQDYIFRWPLIFSLVYGSVLMGRTLFLWIDVDDVSSIGLFGDPPVNALLAVFGNGVILSWVCVYVLFLYLRRHR
jgi:hypothetical protein